MAIRKVGDDEKSVKRCICSNCGSILEYLPVDIQERNYTDYSGLAETVRFIVCPQCSKQVEVRGY